MTAIGIKIKNRREELKMSQDDLAKKLGYKSRSSVNKIELGQRNIPYSKIVKIASALNVPPSALLDDDASLLELVAADNGFEAAHTLLEGSRKYRAEAEKTLSDAKKHLIECVEMMTDDQVAAIQQVVDTFKEKE